MPKVNLNARNVLTLPAAGDRTDYTDEGLPGFVLRVTANGARTYCVRYGATGKRLTLGSAFLLSLSDARAKAKGVLGRVAAEGADPAAEKAAARAVERAGATSFQTLAERLISEADLGDRTRYNWTRLLEGQVYAELGEKDPATITRAEVRELLLEVAEETPVQANDVLKVIRWVYARAMEADLVQMTPCGGLRKPTKERPRDRVATNAELRALWEAAQGEGSYGQAVRLDMLTACRREEVFSARKAEIDREARVWRVPAARTKNARPHDVPLTDDALAVVDGLLAESDGEWLLPGRIAGRPLRPTSKAWAELLKAAGLEDSGLRFHDIRRTVRDRLTSELSIDVTVAEACIGHTQAQLVRTYAPSGVPLRDKRLALERWAALLRRIVGRSTAKVARIAVAAR